MSSIIRFCVMNFTDLNPLSMNFFQSHIGELAALSVSFFWTFSALFFEKSGKRVGSIPVNIIRLFLSIFLLGLITLYSRGMFFPLDASSYNWGWLGLSGIVGFFLGDMMLFASYQVIGSRTATLIMSLHPMLTAIIGWFFLSEVLSAKSMIAILISMTGIMTAITNRVMKIRIAPKGFLLAFGGALGQAGGLILSKKGMGDFDPVAATQIRAIFGFFSFVIFISIIGHWKNVRIALTDFAALKAVVIGTFAGPVIGVSLSLFAIQHTQTGIASMLMGLTPIFIIVPSTIMFKERITMRQLIGTVVAMLGASLFFIRF